MRLARLLRVLAAALLCAALAVSCAGLAASDYIYYGAMVVVNCQEWVSLRDVPGTGGNRLAKVPLGAVVTDAEWMPIQDQFIYCCYDGQWGYILSQYLEQTEYGEPEEPSDWSIALDAQVNGLHILAERSLVGEGEYMLVTCLDGQGEQRWFYETMTGGLTELTLVNAFMGGTEEEPLVLAYNAEKGLTALDADTGEARWTLADADLGGGVCCAVDGDGNAYIGGYYGPDPVAVGMDGRVKWRSDSGGCAWLYDLAVAGDTLVCRYDMMDGDAEVPGTVTFDLDGKLLEKRID